MRKYPVTSESGVEYEVRVEEYMNTKGKDTIVVSLLTCSKGIFGRKKKRFLCNYKISEEKFNEEYSRNYIRLIKSVVVSGEKTYYKPMKEFERWNGDCNKE